MRYTCKFNFINSNETEDIFIKLFCLTVYLRVKEQGICLLFSMNQFQRRYTDNPIRIFQVLSLVYLHFCN